MLKKSMSALAVRRLVGELAPLVGAHFQKAYQLDHGTLVLRFAQKRDALEGLSNSSALARSLLNGAETSDSVPEELSSDEGSQGGSYCKAFLYFSMGHFMFLSKGIDQEMPKDPSPFAMKLRSALGNRKLASVRQVAMDRLVVLEFEPDRYDGSSLALYLELFGDGNAILVRGDTIEAPFTSRSWSSRTLKRGEPFHLPPSGKDPGTLTPDDVGSILADSSEDLVHFLIRRCGLPPVHAEEVCSRLGLERKAHPSTLGPGAAELISGSIKELLDELGNGSGAVVHFTDGAPELLEPFLLRSFFCRSGNRSAPRISEAPMPSGPSAVHEPSMSLAIERYMASAGTDEVIVDRSRERELDRLRKQLSEQMGSKASSLEASERYRRIGDAVYLHYTELSELLDTFEEEEFCTDPASYPLVVSYSPAANGSRGKALIRMEVDGATTDLELDMSKDTNGNANAIYELSKKERRRAEGLDLAIAATKERLTELEEKASAEEEKALPSGGASRPKGGKLRTFWFESFRWCLSSDNVLLLAGRDARSNEKLVKKYLRDDDLYAHADISGAASVVIRAEKDREAPDASREEGCHLSVLHSKAWHSKVGSASAYWVMSHQVSRTPQSGEFVAKGSFIIRGKKNLVDKLPLIGAVGTVYIEGVPKAMFGPERAVSARCSGNYYRLTPGRTKKTDAAKVIAGSLGCELDQVLSVLPAGDMDIVRVERHSEG